MLNVDNDNRREALGRILDGQFPPNASACTEASMYNFLLLWEISNNGDSNEVKSV
jgi:hypothetical protein